MSRRVKSEQEIVDFQQKILREIANAKRETPSKGEVSLGARVADKVVKFIGSWTFIIVQSACLAGWIALNILWKDSWDRYPFILLNLMLSFQAAFTAPLILMASNRSEQEKLRKAERAYNSIDHIEKIIQEIEDSVVEE